MEPETGMPPSVEWSAKKRPLSPLTVKSMVALFLFIAVSTGPRYLPPAWGTWLGTETSHWLTLSANLPAWVSTWRSRWIPASWVDWPARPGSSSTAATGSWPWILTGSGTVTATFGWQNPGPNARFLGGVTVQTPAGQPVLSGPGGAIASVKSAAAGITVQEQVAAQITVVVEGLAQATVHSGEKVGRGQPLGTTGTHPLTVEVLDRGYPVNPLDAKFFGHPTNLRS